MNIVLINHWLIKNKILDGSLKTHSGNAPMAKFMFYVLSNKDLSLNLQISWKNICVLKSGFNAQAFVLGPIWLFMNQAWRAFFLYFLVGFCLLVFVFDSPFWMQYFGVLLVPLHVWCGLSANRWKRVQLAKCNYLEVASINAKNLEDARQDFLTLCENKKLVIKKIETETSVSLNFIQLILNFVTEIGRYK